MEQMVTATGAFRDKEGHKFQGVTLSEYQTLWTTLQTQFGLTLAQIVEAGALSMAMVSRYALGLSASGGKVLGLVDDTPAGWVTLATLRHLSNGGSDTAILTFLQKESVSEQFSLHTQALMALNTPIEQITSISGEQFQFLLDSCHNIICGLYDRSLTMPPGKSSLIDSLNEARIPVHCVESPLGVNVDTGLSLGSGLFASSTLSLGLPFAGLITGSDYVGRHYLADISFPRAFYQIESDQIPSLFAEQPVIQIFNADDSGSLDFDLEELTKESAANNQLK